MSFIKSIHNYMNLISISWFERCSQGQLFQRCDSEINRHKASRSLNSVFA